MNAPAMAYLASEGQWNEKQQDECFASLFWLYKRLERRSNVSAVVEARAFSGEWVFAQAASQAASFSCRAFSFRCDARGRL